jgi:hypothetical protein
MNRSWKCLIRKGRGRGSAARRRTDVDPEPGRGNGFAAASGAAAWPGQPAALPKEKSAVLAGRRLQYEPPGSVTPERFDQMGQVIFDLALRRPDQFGELSRRQPCPDKEFSQALPDGFFGHAPEYTPDETCARRRRTILWCPGCPYPRLAETWANWAFWTSRASRAILTSVVMLNGFLRKGSPCFMM